MGVFYCHKSRALKTSALVQIFSELPQTFLLTLKMSLCSDQISTHKLCCSLANSYLLEQKVLLPSNLSANSIKELYWVHLLPPSWWAQAATINGSNTGK